MAVVKKSKYRIDVGANKVVYLKRNKTAISGIATEIGWTLDEDGIPPDGKTIVAENLQDAMDQGMVPFRLTYLKAKKSLSATVLVAPSKADTVKNELIGKTYNGGKISKVGAPRRVKYVA